LATGLSDQSTFGSVTKTVAISFGKFDSILFYGSMTGNGATENQDLIEVYELRFRLTYRPVEWPVGFWAGNGREYGSWITSRSSNYSSGDYIKDPSGIIESILRDELGLANDDIDLTTFIDAENTSVEMKVNLHDKNKGSANDIIKQICEQSTFAYIFTASGKARLIPLNDSSPTTSEIIPMSRIVKGDINVSKTDWIINEIVVNSRWQEEYNKYIDSNTYSNTTSQAENWGTQIYRANWKFINGTSSSHVANHYIRSADGSASDDDGIWCGPHTIIEFKTAGYSYAHLDIGDWIELDDSSVDKQILCWGESWSGKQFLIFGMQYLPDSVLIKAIELF